jgi:hypothetical protein
MPSVPGEKTKTMHPVSVRDAPQRRWGVTLKVRQAQYWMHQLGYRLKPASYSYLQARADRQQGSGSGMHTEGPQLPEAPKRHCDSSTEGSRHRTLDIPFRVGAKEVEAVMNQQAQFVGN